MRYKLIACEVLYRELCDALARSPHQIDVDFQPKGLHDLGGEAMSTRLQDTIDHVNSSTYDAILLGYALCGNGLRGLTARTIPLVAPRAHDCIALLMGSRHRYQQYFDANEGVFFRSTGWLERGKELLPLMRTKTGVDTTLDQLIARYGEENGRYLYEELNRYRSAYRQLTYIETGLEPNGSFEQQAQEEAARRGWSFAKIAGDLALIRQLVSGNWLPADFLIVEPGYRIAARYDEQIIEAERVPV
jgi:hypothetical protein